MSKTTEIQIEKSRLLIDSFRKNIEQLAGVREEELNKMSADLDSLHEMGKEVDAIREKLSVATKKMNEVMATVKYDFADKKKLIKLNYPQERWIEFGVTDKR